MNSHHTLSGIPGILRPFKATIEEIKEGSGKQIVFYGVPGTCLPFVELLCHAVRTLPFQFVFVPFLNEQSAVMLHEKKNIGFQTGDSVIVSNPAALVIMGGLAMPQVQVTAREVANVITQYPSIPVIGVCFMHMFEKEGWLDSIHVDCLIDAEVTVSVEYPRSAVL